MDVTRVRVVSVIAAACAAMTLMAGCTADGSSSATGSAQAAGAEIDSGGSSGDAAGGSGDSTGSSAPDPCTLITQEQVAAISGVPVGECEPDDGLSTDFQSIASFTNTEDVWPIVQVLISDGAGQAARQRESAEEWLGETADVEIAGISNAYSVVDLYVAGDVGDYFLQVAWLGPDTASRVEEVSQIAQIVAAAM